MNKFLIGFMFGLAILTAIGSAKAGEYEDARNHLIVQKPFKACVISTLRKVSVSPTWDAIRQQCKLEFDATAAYYRMYYGKQETPVDELTFMQLSNWYTEVKLGFDIAIEKTKWEPTK